MKKHVFRTGFSQWGLSLLIGLGAAVAFGAERIDDRRELMLDMHLIESLDNATLRRHAPVPRETAIVFDAPWEGNTSTYPVVFQDGDRYRLYYRAKQARRDPERLAYAESRDGIHWTKPALGLVEFEGSTRNNILLEGDPAHNFAPFKDLNPAAPPEERYKAITGGSRTGGGLVAYGSPDGIRWSLLSEDHILTDGDFDSLNLAFYDTVRQCYVSYFRVFRHGIKNLDRRVRDIKTTHSTDFLDWPNPAEWLDYGDLPEEHLYTNAILPYPRAPHIYIGLPMRFMKHRRWSGSPLSGLSDAVFMSSRDGRTFTRWREAIIRPGLRDEQWYSRNTMPAWGMVETPPAIPGEPNELSIYVSEGYTTDRPASLRRYTWRLDGFASFNAPLDGGEVLTRPVVFGAEGDPRTWELLVNFSTSAAGSLVCEVLDPYENPIPGFTAEEFGELYGDAVEQRLSWGENSDLRALAGQPVRLRFILKDADLYAFRFNTPE